MTDDDRHQRIEEFLCDLPEMLPKQLTAHEVVAVLMSIAVGYAQDTDEYDFAPMEAVQFLMMASNTLMDMRDEADEAKINRMQ